jgi:hypothetical protein
MGERIARFFVEDDAARWRAILWSLASALVCGAMLSATDASFATLAVISSCVPAVVFLGFVGGYVVDVDFSRGASPEIVASAESRHPDWLGELLSPKAVLASIALVVQPWLLMLRAREFGQASALLSVAAYGTGDNGLIGPALTLTQMIGGAAFLMQSSGRLRDRYVKFLSGSAWLIATALDLSLCAMAASGAREKLIAMELAVTLILLTTASGILVIDCLIVPATLSLAWAFRNAFARMRKAAENATTAVPVPLKHKAQEQQ